MKKLLSLLMVGFLAISLTACGGGSSSSSDKETVGFSISTLSNPFFVTMRDEAQKKADELGINLQILDSQDTPATQITNIETMVSQGVKVIIVNPTDSDAIAPTVQKAIDSGVKIITVDRSLTNVTVSTHIASDNVKGGEMAGNFIAEKLGDKGGVIQLEGIPGASAAIERGKGFEEAIKGKLTLVASQTANFDRAQGLTVMENLVQANQGKFQAVYAQNDEMMLGALPALSGVKDVITVGFDGGTEALQAIKDGKMTATIMQQPGLMGQLAVENAQKLLKGESIEASIPSETILVTKDNVDQYLK